MESTILYSTAGTTEILVALPEPAHGILGSYAWQLPTTPGMKATLIETLSNPHPTPEFSALKVYSIQLETQAAHQPFVMLQAGIHPPVALLNGTVSMITHPVMRATMVHANLPTGGVDKLPLLIAVRDNSGSTGYHWTEEGVAGLTIQQHLYPPQVQAIGASGTKVYFINSKEPGAHAARFCLMPPAGVTPVYTINVSVTSF
jgi:predicted secreted protein